MPKLSISFNVTGDVFDIIMLFNILTEAKETEIRQVCYKLKAK